MSGRTPQNARLGPPRFTAEDSSELREIADFEEQQEEYHSMDQVAHWRDIADRMDRARTYRLADDEGARTAITDAVVRAIPGLVNGRGRASGTQDYDRIADEVARALDRYLAGEV